MTSWDDVDLTVRKATAIMPVALDTDGTPLLLGERMVKVEPGYWMHPDWAAIMEFLDHGSND